MDQPFEIDPIVTKYIREENLTPEEQVILRDWISRGTGRQEMLDKLRLDPTWTKQNLARIEDLPTDRVWNKLESRLQGEGYWLENAPPIRRSWWRYAAAASIVIAGITLWSLYRPKTKTPAVAVTTLINDVQPGGNKATLTLADGHTIDLDSSANGIVATQGNTLVAKLDGKLAYNKAASEAPSTPAYNVLATPRAGQFTLSLPDGTRVWLNNASSLRYPVWFTGAAREVDLTGEAYFEVAKDAAHPFRVHIHNGPAGADGGAVDVLGTSFNIMAYSDENAERATLVSGSIRYSHGAATALLEPGEQSVLNARGDLKTLHGVNIDEITAWKNGFFHFDHSSLQSTMRQLARWYDITVEYRGAIPPVEFMGEIDRNLTLSAILHGIGAEQHIHFKVEGKKLIVMP
ncbi:MAG TPA: FecR domain-containing protein [Puia sp.]|nr:FecR domain-containing protein [Puia sp.]